jgi:type II secretory pathway component PulM
MLIAIILSALWYKGIFSVIEHKMAQEKSLINQLHGKHLALDTLKKEGERLEQVCAQHVALLDEQECQSADENALKILNLLQKNKLTLQSYNPLNILKNKARMHYSFRGSFGQLQAFLNDLFNANLLVKIKEIHVQKIEQNTVSVVLSLNQLCEGRS